MAVQAAIQGIVGRRRRSALIEHDDVEAGEFWFAVPERFPNDSLQSVSTAAHPTVLLADGETQPRGLSAIRSIENCEHFVAASLRFFEDATVGVLVSQPA